MDYYPIWSYHIQNYQSLPAKLTQVTQKLILSNNIAGKGIRILLSHYYSNHDITFYDMFMKINTNIYPLTIHNQNKITLHPQDSIYTDTLPLNINTKDKIEIIMTIDSEGPINGYVGLNSQQMLTIEHSCQIDCDVFKKDFNKYVYFGIEAIEIQTDMKPFIIGVFGDSLVHQGYWMNALYRRIYHKYDNVVMYNEGISGNRLLKDASSTSSLSTIFGQAGISRFKHDMYKRYQPDLILFALGINDLVHPGNGSPLKELPSIEDMINGYKSIMSDHLYLCTMTPFYNYDMIWDEHRENLRESTNQWIRKQKHLDIDKWIKDQNDSKRLNRDYDSGDHLHFNQEAGNKIANEILKIIEGEINHE